MKKTALILLVSALLCLPVSADAPEPPEEVITAVNPQAHAIDAYQLLEQSLKFTYNGYPDHYSGCWLEGDVLHVGITSDDEGTLSIYRDILAPAKCEIKYINKKYSYNQLMIFNEVIWSGHAVDPLAEPISLADTCGLNSSGIVTNRNCVEITSEQGYSDELYAALVSFAEDMGADEDIFYLERDAVEIVAHTEQSQTASAADEDVNKITDFYFNPLEEYFFSEYGDGIYPDDYAGCWFSNRFDMHIMLTEDVTDENRLKYIDVAATGHVGVITTETAVFSLNELNRALSEVKSRFGAEYTIGKVYGEINKSENRIDLTVNYLNHEREAILEGIASELGASEWYILFAVTEPADASPSVDCAGPPENYAPVSVFANPMDEYAHENNGYPDYYAGHRYPFGDLVVYITEDADESDLDEIRAIYGSDVTVEIRKYSLDQLTDAYESALEYTENTVWGGIDIDKNRVVLHTFEPVEKIAELLRRTAGRIGVENDIFELNESTYPDTTADEFICESGKPSDAAAVLLDEWESSQRNPPHDYLGYAIENDDTIVIKVTKNDEETFDKFHSIVSAAGCDIRFEIVNNSAVTMETYRDLFKKQIGHYDKNPYQIYAVGISDSGDGYIYILREKYVMGEDTTDELAEYIENIMRTHRHFDSCEVRILEYELSPDSYDYLRNPESEVIFITESLALPAAQPQTSPETADPAGLLCIVFSALSAAGAAVLKRRK